MSNKNDAKNQRIFEAGFRALAYGGPVVRAAANAYSGHRNTQQGGSSSSSSRPSNIMHYKSGSKGSGLAYGSANFKAKDFGKL